MKAIELKQSFGLENLHLVDRNQPDPGPGEVLVRLAAASLNFRDYLLIQGLYNPKQPLPLVPCSDGAGEVVAVGEGVESVAAGDLVCSTFFQAWDSGQPTMQKASSTLGSPLDGVLSEYRVFPESGLIKAPEHLSPRQAATLPCAALTAWNALRGQGNVQAGDTVLVLGTGGVSLFALQFAKLLGAEVIATSSSDEKLEKVRGLGADHTINYKKTSDWGKEARKLTGKRGVDHVVEVGGAGTLAQSLEAVRLGGTISLIGVLSGTQQELAITPILMKNVRVQGIFVGDRDLFAAMNRAISQNRLEPVLDADFPLADTRAALEHMAAGKHLGKITISIAS